MPLRSDRGPFSQIPLRTKLTWIGILYFAEGFPLGAFYDLFPVYFRQQGVDLAEIGALSLLSAAWSLKFVWAPAIDHVRQHRRWMFVADVLMAVVMGLLAIHGGWGPWTWVAIGAFTVLSATNDIAIDGYTIEMLERGEMGIANGLRIGFYRAGMIAAGVILMLSDWLGWAGAFAISGITLAGLGGLCLFAPPEAPAPERKTGGLEEIRAALARPMVVAPALLLFAGLIAGGFGQPIVAGILLLLAAAAVLWRRRAGGDTRAFSEGPIFGAFAELASRPHFLAVALFILTFKLADTSIGFMVKPFWVDAGFSAAEIGLVSVNIGLALSIAGGVVGGLITDRIGIFHGLWILGLTQIVSNLGYVWAAHAIPLSGAEASLLIEHRVLLYSASAVESFTQGLGTGAFLAFLMAITDKRRAASEYAALSAIFALGRALAGWAGGYGAQNLGYADFFLLTFFLGLPAYALLPWVRAMLSVHNEEEQRAA